MSRAAGRRRSTAPAAVASLAALVVAVTVVQLTGTASSPQRGLDEAVAVAGASHLLDAGWPRALLGDGGPLAAPALWQLAGLARASSVLGFDALAAAPSVVQGGRWLVLPAAVLCAALLWVLARRTGLSTGVAAVAVLVGALSPAAVALHRVVSPEALALPWALAGLVVLATRPGAPRRPASALAGSALLAVGAATSPLVLLLVPLAVAARLGRLAPPATGHRSGAVPPPGYAAGHRRRGRHRPVPRRPPWWERLAPVRPARPPRTRDGIATAAACAVLLGLGALVGVRAAGSLSEGLDPGPRGTGGLATSTSGVQALATWAQLDVVVPVLVLVLVPVALWGRAWRVHALAAGAAVAAVVVLDLPAVAVAVALVPCALFVAAAAGSLAARVSGAPHPAPGGGPAAGRARTALSAAGALALTLGTGAVWAAETRAVAARSTDVPVAEATAWLLRQPDAGGVLADLSVLLDLSRSGEERLIALAPDGTLRGRLPAQRGVDQWVVETAAVRDAGERDTRTGQVLAASRQVQAFGQGPDRVAVRVLDAVSAGIASPADDDPPAPADETQAAPTPPSTPPPTAAPTPPPTAAPSPPPTASPTQAPPPASPLPTLPPVPPPTELPTGVSDPRASAELAANPNLVFGPEAARVLAEEPIDTRLLALLAVLAAEHDLSVTDFPLAEGQSEGDLRRTALIDAVDGRSLTSDPAAADDVVAELAAQDPSYRPQLQAATVTGDGPPVRQLVVRLPAPTR